MTDKNLLEDDIIDLTDLLEEGSPPRKTEQAVPRKKGPEPDSFDLGKEISMDFDVSVEEIEHESAVLADEAPLVLDEKPQEPAGIREEAKEPLGDIGGEIDLAMQDKIEEVSLTKNEEEALLTEGPEEAITSPREEEHLLAVEEPRQETGAPAEEPEIPRAPAAEPESAPQAAGYAPVPTEVIIDAVVGEFRKDMPALLENIVRPIVQELLQEIISSTREALPGIVEKVIREEIERLKKL